MTSIMGIVPSYGFIQDWNIRAAYDLPAEDRGRGDADPVRAVERAMEELQKEDWIAGGHIMRWSAAGIE